MKIRKFEMLASVVVVAVATIIATTYWTPKERNKLISSKSISFLKMKKNDKKGIAKDNWSQKKLKVKSVLKADSPDKFDELHSKIRTAPGKLKPDYERNYRFNELLKAKVRNRMMKSSANSVMGTLNWIERGPANVGGRTRTLVVDPDDATFKTWFAGSVGGGVWKTTNAGTSWIPLTDDLPNLAVTCLEMSKSNTNVMYAGTGEGFYNADGIQGNGIMKTTDKGATWSQLSSTATDPNFSYVNRLAVDPTNEDVVVAATNSGIFKTTDGGSAWSKVYSSKVPDMRANPSNFNTIFASTSLGVIRSHDAGNTWVLPNKAKFGGGRIEIATALSDTNRLYASVDTTPNKIYSTFDGGDTWIEVTEEDGSDKKWLGDQGWYDNTIGVNPFDENIIYFGGIDLWKAVINTDSILGITNITDENLDTLFTYTPTDGLPERAGGIGTGKDFWDKNVLANTDLTNIEVRFGVGKSQKAHLFANNTYQYKDYVDVPFEVWDTKNNRQLMCSFTDVYRNNVYNLGLSRGDVLFINNVDYNATNPSSDIAKNKGLKYENLFVIAFRMASGKKWDAENLPNFKLAIEVGKLPSLTRNSVAITDGYNQYATPNSVHPDHHNITVYPTNVATNEFIFLNGNDGGIAVSYDAGATFTEVGDNGYNTSQFYGVDKRPGAKQYFGGLQDNGTWVSDRNVDADKTTKYGFRIGGDGFEVSWHYTDGKKMIGGAQFNTFYKTDNEWQSYAAASVGFDGWGNSKISPFISKLAKSYSDPDLLYTITTKGVYKSENFGDSWSLIPLAGLNTGGYFNFAQVAISIAEPQVVWAGAYSDALYVSKDGGVSFAKASNNSFIASGILSGFDTHPTDEATAYATFSFSGRSKVLRTTNYGQTWQDISGFGAGSTSSNGFPNVAAYCVSVMPYNTDIIWVGTDIGLVESTDGGATWHLANNGLPQVAIWEIRIVDDEVVVATHGRGIWSVVLPELAGHKPPVATLAPVLNSANQSVSGLVLNASLRSAYDSTHVVVNNKSALTVKTNKTVDTTFVIPISSSGTVSVSIVSFKGSRTYESATKEVQITALLETQKGYITNFASASDFVLDGLSIGTISGFSRPSLNSPHPYPDVSSYIAVLKVPIIVAATDANLKYDDIAIIEPGSAGTVFGDSEFFDYVILEASNGGDWKSLADGYDARYNSDWKTAYNGSASGTESMYKTHSINLLDKFSAGDTLLIRFRLFSDQYTSGWGWSIDNLIIQDQFVGVNENENIPLKFKLSQNYPNPFNPSTKISFSLPTESKVKLQIFNSLGEVITTLVNETNSAGIHEVNWNASNLASGVYLYRIHAESINSSEKFNSVKKMLLIK